MNRSAGVLMHISSLYGDYSIGSFGKEAKEFVDFLETDTDVPYGTMPNYDGKKPTKDGNAQYSYTFVGWDPEVTKVSGDATYTAKFNESTNLYTIIWNDYDGNTIKFRFCADCLDLFIDDYLLRKFVKKPEITDCFEWCKKVPAYYR